MVEQEIVQSTPDRGYVDWAAIFAGATVAAGVAIVLTTFAGGLGLNSVSIDEGGEISVVWMIITALFVIISMVASYMLGGYVTGRMRRPAGTATGDETTVRDGLNGLVVWGLGTLVSGLMVASLLSGGAKAVGNAAQTAVETTGTVIGGTAQGAGQLAGGVISGAGSAVGGVAQGAGQAAAPSVEQMLPEGLKNNPLDYFTDTLFRSDNQTPAGSDVASSQRQVTGILANLLRTGEISDSDRTWISNEVSARTGLSPEEARARTDEAVQRVQATRGEAQKKVDEAEKAIADLKTQTENTAKEAKEKAADIAEKTRIAGILTAFLLAASALVAAVAAYIGAVHGGRHRDEGRIWGGLAYRK